MYSYRWNYFCIGLRKSLKSNVQQGGSVRVLRVSIFPMNVYIVHVNPLLWYFMSEWYSTASGFSSIISLYWIPPLLLALIMFPILLQSSFPLWIIKLPCHYTYSISPPSILMMYTIMSNWLFSPCTIYIPVVYSLWITFQFITPPLWYVPYVDIPRLW